MNIRKYFWFKYVREFLSKLHVLVDAEGEIDRYYYQAFKKHANLKEPKDLIEKIYWMELHTDTSMWTLCADKYRIREYISDLGLIQYMPKLYGKWDKASDVDFDKLPNSFVIKSNNGCATVKVVTDKTSLNIKKFRNTLWQWLHLPYGYQNCQLHYTKIKPCIIAEELLDNDYPDISPASLVDFKVYCINGEPQFIWVAYNRINMHVHVQCFDTKWTPKPDYLKNGMSHYVYDPNDKVIEKPQCLEELLDVARKISAPFPQLRADFYIVKGKPIIGEMTFTQGYGFLEKDVYDRLGDMINLGEIEKIR